MKNEVDWVKFEFIEFKTPEPFISKLIRKT